LAVFSLIALLVLLAGVALLSLRPWETDSVGPQVWVSPEVGLGLDDSVAVAPSQRPHVASAHVADGGYATFADQPRVAVPDRVSAPVLDVSAARPVSGPKLVAIPTRPAEEAPPAPPPLPPPVVALPEPVAATAPTPVPVVLPAPPPRSVATDGGPGGFSAVRIREGDEYAFAFSFYIEEMVYGEPGTDNLIMQFKGDASDARTFGLQLWEDADVGLLSRGLWSSGEAVGGDRFLAPVPEGVWHEAVISFKASSQGAGFYEVYLDGQLVDARAEVSLIAPASSYAQIEIGLFRDGEPIAGTTEIRIDAAMVGESLESNLP
jgi:polysaccharide lyase-like protein